MTNENANVVTAKASPRSRRPGMPSSAATTAPAIAAEIRATSKKPVRSATTTDATAPMPAKAYWPRESCPARPVTTLTDSPMIDAPTTTVRTDAVVLLTPKARYAA